MGGYVFIIIVFYIPFNIICMKTLCLNRGAILKAICLPIIFLVSCSNFKDDTKNIQPHNSTEWKTEIMQLNAHYAQLIGVDDSLAYKRIVLSRKASNDVDGWEVAGYDLTGFLAGGKIAGLPGGVAAGALLSVASYLVQKTENKDVSVPSDSTAESVASWLRDNSPDGLDVDYTDFIDSRDPIVKWIDWSATMNDAIGVEAGPMHNFIITQLLTNPEYNHFEWNDEMQCKEAILNIMLDHDMFVSADEYMACDEIMNIYLDEDWSNTLDVEEAYNEIESRLIDIKDFFDIAFCLDSAMLCEYADAYTTIIDEAWRQGDILYEDAVLLNGAISVGCYSHMMWRKYRETEESTNIRMVFETSNNIVIYCTKEQLPILSVEQDVYIGIPHFVRGYLAEVYFYPNEINSVSSALYLQLDANTDYFITANASDIENLHYTLHPGLYPLSIVPYTFDVQYIKSYEFIEIFK